MTADFFLLRDPNVRNVVIASLILGASSAVVGTFSFLRKRALAGDAVAHSILPGICIAFMLFGKKDPLILMAGAIVTGWLSLYVIDVIIKKSRIKSDSAIGIVLSVFFGVGILLLTSIQHSGNAAQSGLDKFIFGKAAAMNEADVLTFSVAAIVVLFVVKLLYKEFILISFNPEYAKSIGLPVGMLEGVLSFLTIISVATGIQAVGVVLMAALLIAPAAAARFWTDNFSRMIILSALFGAASALGGTYVSYILPNMPTGPWIVVFLTLFALMSVLFSPSRGIIFLIRQQKNNSSKIVEENILKTFYQLSEKDNRTDRLESEILKKRDFESKQLITGLAKLKKKNLLTYEQGRWQMTEAGVVEGMRVTKLHRLWELYLSKKLRLGNDHLHSGAEAMEHLITPEIEALLEKELNYPEKDPHNSFIPYKK